jgi:type IX secretion system substrate protein
MKKYLLIYFLVLGPLISPLFSDAQTLKAITGYGDGLGCDYYTGPAILSNIYSGSVAVDSSGNLFAIDFGGQPPWTPTRCFTLRKINLSGNISTIAGGGTNDLGDGVPATATKLSDLQGVAADFRGNVYITENANTRKIDINGIISTVANGGSGIAIDHIGNLYFVQVGTISETDTFGIIHTVAGGGTSLPGDGGPATAATINPFSVCVDKSGNLFIGDLHRIRKVDASGVIYTIGGNGTYGFSGDGGPATDAQLTYPYGIATDMRGNVYFADQYNDRIRKIDTYGIITTIAGGGTIYPNTKGEPATATLLDKPGDIAIDKYGHIFIDGIAEISDSNFLVSKVPDIVIKTPAISIYPNPTTGPITLTLPPSTAPATITITNLLGTVIETRTIQSAQTQNIDFNLHTPPGAYIIQVTTGTNTWRQKIEVW